MFPLSLTRSLSRAIQVPHHQSLHTDNVNETQTLYWLPFHNFCNRSSITDTFLQLSSPSTKFLHPEQNLRGAIITTHLETRPSPRICASRGGHTPNSAQSNTEALSRWPTRRVTDPRYLSPFAPPINLLPSLDTNIECPTASTVEKLFSAQKAHPHASPLPSQLHLPQYANQDTPSQRSTLHSFWQLPQTPQTIQHGQPSQIPQQEVLTCEGCDGVLIPEYGVDTLEAETACRACGKHVCNTCAITAEMRLCLDCAMQG